MQVHGYGLLPFPILAQMPHPVHPGLILEMNVTKWKDVTKHVRECLQIIEVRLV